MYFSLIRLRRDVSPNDLIALTNGDAYQMHKVIWNLFGDNPDRKRDFLYRYEPVKGWPTFYTVSSREPNDPGGLWDILSKQYTPKISGGERFAFTLRVNPIRNKRDENDRHHRHDVVMDAKTHLRFKELPEDQRPRIAALVQEAGTAWLKSRESEFGFLIEEDKEKPKVRADCYVQHKLFKDKGPKPITFSTLDLNGFLTVVNPERFIEKSLFQGIGPAKGFGCGLMMIRPIRHREQH